MSNPIAAIGDKLLNRDEVAGLLGISKSGLDNLVAGRIKGASPLSIVKIGRRIFFRSETVRAWLAQNETSLGGSNNDRA